MKNRHGFHGLTWIFLVLGILVILAVNARAQTYSTNFAKVHLTVSPADVLLADGQPLNIWYSTADFIFSNQVLRLNPASPDFYPPATNTTTVAFTNIVNMPFLLLTPYTVTHSTNSTFGYGQGLIAADTNYVYISVGLNDWSRIAIPTNTW